MDPWQGPKVAMAALSGHDPLTKGADEANTNLSQPCIPVHGQSHQQELELGGAS